MDRLLTYHPERQGRYLFWAMTAFALALIGFGLLWDTPAGIVSGIWKIIRTQAGLITDSISVGGMGAAFVNAGLVTLLSIGILRAVKISFSGISVASLFLKLR